ncbi:MAG: D-aminoacyl-tRNA deacylase [Solirubrobacterales bacterium]|nr:D-aminoacyl-tRNA deacylase [Solirubrobacterales bacterium]
MKAIVQRVSRASVTVDGTVVSEIGPGLLVLAGITHGDGPVQVEKLARRILALRVFPGEGGDMDSSLGPDMEVLCVSQFTLYGNTSKGNRPSWGDAAPGDVAQPLWEDLCDALGAKRGVFGAMMEVELVNDGPVTLTLEEVPEAN